MAEKPVKKLKLRLSQPSNLSRVYLQWSWQTIPLTYNFVICSRRLSKSSLNQRTQLEDWKQLTSSEANTGSHIILVVGCHQCTLVQVFRQFFHHCLHYGELAITWQALPWFTISTRLMRFCDCRNHAFCVDKLLTELLFIDNIHSIIM